MINGIRLLVFCALNLTFSAAFIPGSSIQSLSSHTTCTSLVTAQADPPSLSVFSTSFRDHIEDTTWLDLCGLSDLPSPGSTSLLAVSLVPPSGDEFSVAVAVDAVGEVHTLMDVVPCVGHQLSSFGVVDGQVKVVFDQVTGRKFYLSTGAPRATRVRRRGFTVDPRSGFAGLATRVLLRPEPTPLQVLPCRIADNNSSLQVGLPSAGVPGFRDLNEVQPSRVRRVFTASAMKALNRRAASAEAQRSHGKAEEGDSRSPPLPPGAEATKLLRDRDGTTDRDSRAEGNAAPDTVFSISYHRLPRRGPPPTQRVRAAVAGLLPRLFLLRGPRGASSSSSSSRQALPEERMGVIVAKRGGVELGRSKFKVVGDSPGVAGGGGGEEAAAMSALLDETFGAEAVAAHAREEEGAERKRVGPLVSLFVEPWARRFGVGDALFRAMLRETRANGYDYALLVHQDNGSGKLIAWYEAMGFKLLPEDNAIGVKDGMVARLPRDVNDEYYMAAIRNACDVYDGTKLVKEEEGISP